MCACSELTGVEGGVHHNLLLFDVAKAKAAEAYAESQQEDDDRKEDHHVDDDHPELDPDHRS